MQVFGLKALFIDSLGQRPRCSDFNKRRLKAFFKLLARLWKDLRQAFSLHIHIAKVPRALP